MANKKVTVTLDSSGNITVSPDPVKIPNGGTTIIQWEIGSGSQPNTQFDNKGIAFKNPPPSGRKAWNQTNQPTGSSTGWQLDDAHNSSTTGGLFAYEVNLVVGTRKFKKDPDIENQVP